MRKPDKKQRLQIYSRSIGNPLSQITFLPLVYCVLSLVLQILAEALKGMLFLTIAIASLELCCILCASKLYRSLSWKRHSFEALKHPN
jgi:hypothetical protein